MADEAASVPKSVRNLRACLKCALVKTMDQFVETGCENCPELGMTGKRNRVEECTSTSFEGLIALTDANRSWVARYQDLKGVNGLYAVAVYGDPSDIA